ncbi:MAG: protein-tyrosine-phosphatase [Flavobacteriales bacterium]|nr:protein-tyrosine-phosphatase [Flavobacteriales bacterium]
MTQTKPTVFKKIEETIGNLENTVISDVRKEILQTLIDYILEKVSENKEARLNFICTHNSRRSHLAQIWAQTLATFYKIPNVVCYSGGTEATAMYPMVAKTLENNGFTLEKLLQSENPVYSIKYGSNALPVIGFSKVYDHDFNPQSEFAAIMTCSQADEGCPFIAGAEKRIPITYDDPKAFDTTPLQEEKYAERSLQIAAELIYVFLNSKK